MVVPTSLDTSPSELFSEDRLRQLMHSMFKDLSPGVVLPMTQMDLPRPHTVSVCVSYVDSSGFLHLGGTITSGVGITISVSRCMDQMRVVNVAPSAVATVASALSLGYLLFPFSDSGFASLSASSSSRPFALPPPPLLPFSVALFSSSISSLASSSFSSSLPFSPSPLPPTPAQHGFRNRRSCLTNLLDFLHDIYEMYEEGRAVDIIYLDFQKAFDKVPHRKLLNKVESHGISGHIHR